MHGYSELLNGISIKTLCYGESMLMSEFRLQKGAVLPEHAHANEQTGYLVSGKIRMFIGNDQKEMLPGDSWSIGSGISHRAEILEDSVAIEVFSPLRKDYLKYLFPVDEPDI